MRMIEATGSIMRDVKTTWMFQYEALFLIRLCHVESQNLPPSAEEFVVGMT